jgi:hypothetical protein
MKLQTPKFALGPGKTSRFAFGFKREMRARRDGRHGIAMTHPHDTVGAHTLEQFVVATCSTHSDLRGSILTMGGTLERAGRTLPANHIAVGACEVVRLDPRLPTAAVEPAELLDYVERGMPGTAALIERAVRIEAARRDEALDLLTPALLARTLEECERCAPALRWLSGQSDPSASGSNWRRWLSARAESRARRATPALDLPIDGKPFLEQR